MQGFINKRGISLNRQNYRKFNFSKFQSALIKCGKSVAIDLKLDGNKMAYFSSQGVTFDSAVQIAD